VFLTTKDTKRNRKGTTDFTDETDFSHRITPATKTRQNDGEASGEAGRKHGRINHELHEFHELTHKMEPRMNTATTRHKDGEASKGHGIMDISKLTISIWKTQISKEYQKSKDRKLTADGHRRKRKPEIRMTNDPPKRCRGKPANPDFVPNSMG